MRVGFTMDFRNYHRRPWAELWEDNLWLMVEAEAMGFDYLMVQEHFFTDDGYAPSVPVFLTALAERTKTVRLGSYIYILPLHHPGTLAQETAVLDHLSGGRLEVTVGIGHRASEYRAFGYSPRSRPSRMEEGLIVLKKAWTERPFSHKGQYFDLQDIEVSPEPLQKPHPPLWVAATTPAAAARAGRFGASLACAAVDPAVYEAHALALRDQGIDPSTVRVSNPWSITVTDEDPDKVWERNRDYYFERWDFYRRIREEMGDPDLEYGLVPSAETYRDYELIGDADTVIETLKVLIEPLPLTDIVHSGPAAGIPIRTEAYEDLKSFAEKVLPVLKNL